MATAGHNYVADWLTEPRTIAQLGAAWDALAMATDPRSVFLRSAWFAAVCDWHGGNSVALLRVTRDNELVGLLPLRRELDGSRWPAARYLRSLDVPDTQQFGMLCGAEDAAAVAGCAARELARIADSYDVLELRKLNATPANDALIANLQAVPRSVVVVADTCPCIGLQQGWADYYSTRSRRLKKGNNLLANRLKKSFRNIAVTRELLSRDRVGDQLAAELLELSAHSWKRDLATALHRPAVTSWLNRLRRLVSADGELVVWCLRLDGVLAAAEIQLELAGQVSALRAEVHEDFDAFGAGTYLNWKVAEALMGSGRERYNMGPGISEYKSRWSNQSVEPKMVTVYGAGMTAWLRWLQGRFIAPARAQVAAMLTRGGGK